MSNGGHMELEYQLVYQESMPLFDLDINLR
jgi:hypothetical protein